MPESSSSVIDVRATLLAHFQGTPSSNAAQQGSKWAELWDADFLPWDRGQPNPALVDTLRDRRDLLGPSWLGDSSAGGAGPRRRKRALVPGCGRGYDVLLLASFGYDAYGLEISATAIAKCKEFAKEHAHEYPAQPGSGGVGKATFILGDFFDDSWRQQVNGGSTFELLYDYTFMSIMPPALRPAWALRYSQLLSDEPSSRLTCVEFPTGKPPATKGPPYGLTPKVYLAHLSRPGAQLQYDDEDNLLEEELGPPASLGLERVAHWQPERTHEVGAGTDWVSIWKRHLDNQFPG